ncbi:putative N-acetyltransferase YhbS [Asanoa ferruginea]|uniref:Putative N-acetyltransferase YhbS n=1 Tax=Asanoa ferruginea TaxID=53367 RepID=A0A3D9ZFZ6_9ACTN|nr:GNAT family N-acetyltransferase [Asanoa ferruginea]REF96336.1 putative N-acetyltransferase YhbS [Asanoa ferruginea]GIF46985.1 GCN5 family N-acetyltransferase [Asanoa ferruginea]
MRIREAHSDDLVSLQDIERSAGELFREIGMPEIADDDPPSLADLTRYQQAGKAWVATTNTDHVTAYLFAEPLDGNLHLEQLSVHQTHARQGIGRELITHAAKTAKAKGMPALTLTTFRDVPWNAPYYERQRFRTLDEHEITPGLRERRQQEADHGLDRWPRVCMRRPTT